MDDYEKSMITNELAICYRIFLFINLVSISKGEKNHCVQTLKGKTMLPQKSKV